MIGMCLFSALFRMSDCLIPSRQFPASEGRLDCSESSASSLRLGLNPETARADRNGFSPKARRGNEDFRANSSIEDVIVHNAIQVAVDQRNSRCY